MSDFRDMLYRATATVRTWPKWKQELLGDALPKGDVQVTIEELKQKYQQNYHDMCRIHEALTEENAQLRNQHEQDEKVMRRLATDVNCPEISDDCFSLASECPMCCDFGPYRSDACRTYIIESARKEVEND